MVPQPYKLEHAASRGEGFFGADSLGAGFVYTGFVREDGDIHNRTKQHFSKRFFGADYAPQLDKRPGIQMTRWSSKWRSMAGRMR